MGGCPWGNVFHSNFQLCSRFVSVDSLCLLASVCCFFGCILFVRSVCCFVWVPFVLFEFVVLVDSVCLLFCWLLFVVSFEFVLLVVLVNSVCSVVLFVRFCLLSCLVGFVGFRLSVRFVCFAPVCFAERQIFVDLRHLLTRFHLSAVKFLFENPLYSVYVIPQAPLLRQGSSSFFSTWADPHRTDIPQIDFGSNSRAAVAILPWAIVFQPPSACPPCCIWLGCFLVLFIAL